MLTYLLIGAAIQGWICVERYTRGVASFEGWTFVTAIVFVGLAAVNIAIWPLTLVFEIINIKMGV